MNDEQLLRYSRHILLPEFGIGGQEKLLAAKVLIVGAGGLGAPVSMYLAASGIGNITIADGDSVDLTNLQRQIVHFTKDIGKKKVDSTKETLRMLNSQTIVETIGTRLNQPGINRLVRESDIVLDCTDNFETRHHINRACVKFNKPLVSGAAIRFEGQVAVFDQSKPGSPCYECLFPQNSELEETRCSELGVVSPLVGIVGAIQAMETIKILTDIGLSMNGKLLLIDSLSTDWKVLKLRKDSNCDICNIQGI